MSEKVLVTGVTVKEQMRIAREILIKEVIPRNKEYERRKRLGKLSKELKHSLKENA